MFSSVDFPLFSMPTWGDNSRSARGANDRKHLALDRVETQYEVHRIAMESRGQGGEAAPLAPPELAALMPTSTSSSFFTLKSFPIICASRR
jgi:hypothetical protein